MKIQSDRPLGDVIRELIETYRLEGRLNEVKVIDSWEQVVGEMIAKHTRDIYIKQGKLFAKIDSPALRNELGYSRTDIRDRLNKAAGADTINEVIFL